MQTSKTNDLAVLLALFHVRGQLFDQLHQKMLPRVLDLPSYGVLISQKVFIKSICKSIFPQKSVLSAASCLISCTR